MSPHFDVETDFTMDGQLGDDSFATMSWKMCPQGGAKFSLNAKGTLALFVAQDLLAIKRPMPIPGLPIPAIITLAGGAGLWAGTTGDVHMSGDLRFSGCMELGYNWEEGGEPFATGSAEFAVELLDPEFDAQADSALRFFLNTPSVSVCFLGSVCTFAALRLFVDYVKGEDETVAFCGGVQAVVAASLEAPWSSSAKPFAAYYWADDLTRTKVGGNGSCDVPLDVPAFDLGSE